MHNTKKHPLQFICSGYGLFNLMHISCLESVLAAFIAICLSQMSLTGSRWTNKSQVLMSTNGIERRQGFEPVCMLALNDTEVEIVECFRNFLRKSAGTKIHIYRVADLLVPKVFEKLVDCRHLLLAEAVLLKES